MTMRPREEKWPLRSSPRATYQPPPASDEMCSHRADFSRRGGCWGDARPLRSTEWWRTTKADGPLTGTTEMRGMVIDDLPLEIRLRFLRKEPKG
jgi:hypothetical protein